VPASRRTLLLLLLQAMPRLLKKLLPLRLLPKLQSKLIIQRFLREVLLHLEDLSFAMEEWTR
jgi:hypothetical protein